MNAKMKITSLLLAAVLTISLPVQALAAALPSDGLSEAVAPVTTVAPDGNGVSETVAEAYVTAAAPDTSVSPDALAAVPTDAVSLDAPDDVVPVPDDTATSDVPDNVSDNFYAVHDEVTDVIDISTPIADGFSTLSAGEEKSITNMFNFSLDPFGLVQQTGASRYDGVSHANTGVLFTNLTDVGISNNVKYMSNRSDYLKLSNETTKPKYLTLRMEVIGLDSAGILMDGQPQYSSAQTKWTADINDSDPRLKFEVISNGNTELEHGLPVESTTSTGYVFWEYTYYLAAADVVANDGDAIAADRTGKINANDAYHGDVTEAVYDTQWNPETYEDEDVLVTPASITSDCSSIAFQLVGTINNNKADWSDVSDLSGASLKVSWKAWDVESDPEDTNPYDNVEVGTLSIDDENTQLSYEFAKLFSSKTVDITWADDDAKQLVGNLILRYGIDLAIKADDTIESAQFGTANDNYHFTVSGTTVTIKKAEDESTLATIVFPIATGQRATLDSGTVKFTNVPPTDQPPEPTGDTIRIDSGNFADTQGHSAVATNVFASASIVWTEAVETGTIKADLESALIGSGITFDVAADGTISNPSMTGTVYTVTSNANKVTIKSGSTEYATITFVLANWSDTGLTNSANGTVKLGEATEEPPEEPPEEPVDDGSITLTVSNGTDTLDDDGRACSLPINNVVDTVTLKWTDDATDSDKTLVKTALATGSTVTISSASVITDFNNTKFVDEAWSIVYNDNELTIRDMNEEPVATVTITLKSTWNMNGAESISGSIKLTFPAEEQPGTPSGDGSITLTVSNGTDTLDDDGGACSLPINNVVDTVTLKWADDATSADKTDVQTNLIAGSSIAISSDLEIRFDNSSLEEEYGYSIVPDGNTGKFNILNSSEDTVATVTITLKSTWNMNGAESISGLLKLTFPAEEQPGTPSDDGSITLTVSNGDDEFYSDDDGAEYSIEIDDIVDTVELVWKNAAEDDKDDVKTYLSAGSTVTISSDPVITDFKNNDLSGQGYEFDCNGNTITFKNGNTIVATLTINLKSTLANWFGDKTVENEEEGTMEIIPSISGAINLTVPAGRNNAPARNVFALAAPAMNMTALPSMSVDAPDDDEPIDNTVADVNPDVPDTDEAPDTPVEAVESTPDEIGETVMESDTPSDTMDNVTNAVSDVNDEDSDDVQTVEEVTSENPTEATAPDEDDDDDDANLTDADDADDDDDAVSDDTDATFDTADDVSNDDDATSNSTDAVSDTDATSHSTDDVVSDTDDTSNTTDATSDDE